MGQALDPLTTKLLGTAGESVAKGMSKDLIDWMRESALLWVKQGGGEWKDDGSDSKSRSLAVVDQTSLDEMRQKYNLRINNYIRQIHDHEATIKILKARINHLETENGE